MWRNRILRYLMVVGMFLISGMLPGPIRGQGDFILVGEEIRNAKVVDILDHGLIVLDIDGRDIRFLLACIGFPDPGSESGQKAMEFLKTRLRGKTVEAHIVGYLKGGDLATGHIVSRGEDPRFPLVERGLARYCPGSIEEKGLEELERRARNGGRGIWAPSKTGDIPECGDPA